MKSLPSYYSKDLLEAGCDEAGRGCLAGPVFAAAVILPHNFMHPGLNDSKQLSEKERLILRPYIEMNAIAWAVASVSEEEIDRINILNASIKAMHLAVSKLAVVPELLLIDGNRFKPYQGISHQCFIEGDSRFASIAAASVLAKTYRDDYMNEMHIIYPQYRWNKNKGYGTAEHRKMILSLGLSPMHRKSFHLKEAQQQIPFNTNL
ncbi:MAG: ribonuclease HII [Bacteroidetes bacterium]|nr:MAG: ribonuclease HII [Bacteroidota bacterium]REK06499.1 MAG: ribonuclease HII [Bacteroidota bacterium]REK33265.1 MAG: ribonuclease HII [Bacteroidota bacterium]REK47102.1 MAG: ribonuclease HII [Bacteroidota bacterium]